MLLDQRLAGQLFARRISPQRCSHVLVQRLGKSLSEPVSQCFQQDVGIIILVGLKPRTMRLDPVNADREAADPVAIGVDEVGKAHIRPVARFLHLLAQEGKPDVFLGVREVDRHIIPVARAGPQPRNAARGQPFFRYDLVEHRIGIGE